jgi:membrane protein YqaA with SNARE-associated domain
MAGCKISFYLMIANIFNWLGGMSSYGLGYLGNIERLEKLFEIQHQKITQLKMYISKYRSFAAFFCLLPFVRDSLAVAIGLFRSNSLNVTV